MLDTVVYAVSEGDTVVVEEVVGTAVNVVLTVPDTVLVVELVRVPVLERVRVPLGDTVRAADTLSVQEGVWVTVEDVVTDGLGEGVEESDIVVEGLDPRLNVVVVV